VEARRRPVYVCQFTRTALRRACLSRVPPRRAVCRRRAGDRIEPAVARQISQCSGGRALVWTTPTTTRPLKGPSLGAGRLAVPSAASGQWPGVRGRRREADNARLHVVAIGAESLLSLMRGRSDHDPHPRRLPFSSEDDGVQERLLCEVQGAANRYSCDEGGRASRVLGAAPSSRQTRPLVLFGLRPAAGCATHRAPSGQVARGRRARGSRFRRVDRPAARSTRFRRARSGLGDAAGILRRLHRDASMDRRRFG
jgi:hypothetical protein